MYLMNPEGNSLHSKKKKDSGNNILAETWGLGVEIVSKDNSCKWSH